MRILVIDNGLIAGTSGGDTHAIKVAQQWAEENDVFFLSSKHGCSYIENTLCRPIVCETPLHLDQRLNIYATIPNILIHIQRILAALSICLRLRHPMQVIVSSSHYPHDVIPALLLRLKNRASKLVIYNHSSFPEIPSQAISLRRLASILYNYVGFILSVLFADLIFTVNHHTLEQIRSYPVKRGAVVLTSNGVDTEQVSKANGKKVFDACFIGRLDRPKGIFDLISVWKSICRQKKTAKLAIVGSGPEEEKLRECIKEAGLTGNIVLLGSLSDAKYAVLKASRVFVFPSYFESWGLAIAEAMACGLPVVAYNLRVYKEIFDDNLVTVPLGDVDAMAKKVIFLLENSNVANEMGEAGREFVKRYSWSKVAERELSDILKLVNQCDEDVAFL